MTTPIPLSDCPGLIDLMLTGEELGPSFDLNGAQCTVGRIAGHATFKAVSPDDPATRPCSESWLRVSTSACRISC